MPKYKSVIKYNGQQYGIIKVWYKGYYYPILLDKFDYLEVKELQKKFVTDTYGRVFCVHKYRQIKKKIYIHRIIKALHDPKYSQKGRMVIFHLNNINLDNRLENLRETEIKGPRKRTIILNDEYVTPEMIPPFVSYMKPNKTHGSRFSVVFDNIKWKSTSSKNLSLKYKLEQTKKFLRIILLDTKIKQKYFKKTLTNDANSDKTNSTSEEIGQRLFKTYYIIVRMAGYRHIKRIKNKSNSTMLLRYSAIGLSDEEKKLLEDFTVDISKYQTLSSNVNDDVSFDLSDSTDKGTVIPTIP